MNESEINTEDCRCPTCGAAQSWRDECRRCGSDIALLRRLAEETVTLRHEWSVAMTAGNFRQAEQILDRLRIISPTVLGELLYEYTFRLNKFTSEFYFSS